MRFDWGFPDQRCIVLDANTGKTIGCGLTFTLRDLFAVHTDGMLVGWLCEACYREVVDNDGRVHLSSTQ